MEGESESGEKIPSLITVWDCSEPEEKLALINSIEDFMRENSHIEIETRHFRNREELEDQFEAASLAGSGPELLLADLDSVQRLAPGNVLKEITDGENGFDYSLIIDGLVEVSEYNRRKYIIPFRGADFLLLFYNKDILEEPPKNFEEVVEYCRGVNNFGQRIYGFLLNSSEPDWVIPFIGGYSEGAYWPSQSLGCEPPNLKNKKTYQSEEALATWNYPEGEKISPESLDMTIEEYTKGVYLDISHETVPWSVDPKEEIISTGWGTKIQFKK